MLNFAKVNKILIRNLFNMKKHTFFLLLLFLYSCENFDDNSVTMNPKIELSENIARLGDPIMVTKIQNQRVDSKTELFKASTSGITYKYKWGLGYFCDSEEYYNQIGIEKIGFSSEGTSNCMTELSHIIKAKITHPKFKNSQIINMVIRFDTKASSFTYKPYPTTGQLVSLNKDCAYKENQKEIFECVRCITPNRCYLISQNISCSSDIWNEQSITINSTTNPNLDIFDSSSVDIILGFKCDNKSIDISGISCLITYI